MEKKVYLKSINKEIIIKEPKWKDVKKMGLMGLINRLGAGGEITEEEIDKIVRYYVPEADELTFQEIMDVVNAFLEVLAEGQENIKK